MSSDTVSTEAPASSKGNVLLVAYHFPPIRSAGIFRIVGMARCLRDEGWRVHVLTVRGSRFDINDPDTLSLVPSGIGITRTPMNDRLAPLYGAPPAPPNATSGVLEDQVSARRPSHVQILRRVLRPLRRFAAQVLGFPDRRVGWVGPLMRAVAQYLREYPGAVVLSSSPPHSSHLALALLKKVRRFPWVADFRDPWTVPPRTRSRVALGLHRRTESFVLRATDHVVANTDGNRSALLDQFRFLSPDRVTTVSNAYDPYHHRDDIHVELPYADLVFIGEVYPGLLNNFVDAVEWLQRQEQRVPVLHIYGEMPAEDQENIAARGLDGYIKYRGSLSYPESLAAMKAANALLLMLRNESGWKTWVPSKLYSYLFSGRPILALGPDGDASSIIEKTNTGRVVRPGSVETIAAGIQKFLKETANGTMHPDKDALQAYRIEETSRRMSAILESVKN